MINKTKNLDSVMLRCDDECSMLIVDKYKYYWNENDEPEIEYNISIQDSNYVNGVNGIIGRAKRAFKILFGKPIYYNDLFIQDEKEIKKFIDELNEIVN